MANANITLRQLRALCAVIEKGSFTEAAKVLHLSQAALSGLIKELESQVGVRLLDRNTRHVTLSTVGESFFPLAKRVLNNLDDALTNINDLKELRRGIVRVAAPEVLSCTLIPDLITAYTEKFSDIHVDFTDVPIENVFSQLRNGEIDVGITSSISSDPEFEKTKLMSIPYWAALRPDDPLARKSKITWEDIKSRKIISFVRKFSERVLSQVPSEHHPARIDEVRRVNTALAMLKVQSGVAICPSITYSLVRGFGLEFRPIEHPVVYRDTSIFTRQGVSASPAVESFIAFTIDFVKWWQALSNSHTT